MNGIQLREYKNFNEQERESYRVTLRENMQKELRQIKDIDFAKNYLNKIIAIITYIKKENVDPKLESIIVEGWTDEQKKEFIIKDNVGFGEWDFDILANEWDTEKLNEWGVDVPSFDNDIDLSDILISKYKIEIECFDEKEQKEIYDKLTKEGYLCKTLIKQQKE